MWPLYIYIYIYFFFFLMCLVKGILIYSIPSKSQFLVLLIFSIIFLVFILFIPPLTFIISFLIALCFLKKFVFSTFFRCKFRFFIWDFSSFLRMACISMKFPLEVLLLHLVDYVVCFHLRCLKVLLIYLLTHCFLVV